MPMCTNHPSVMEDVVKCWRCLRPFCSNCRVLLGGKFYCAQCKLEQVTDMRSGITRDALELAGIGRRWAALIVDGFIIGIPIWIILFAVLIPTMAKNPGAEPPFWINFIGFAYIPVYIVYEGLMLGARGQTVGKIALGIKVVTPAGADISVGQAWGRTAMRNVFVSLLAVVNYLPAFFTKEKTCIHDMAAGTRVIRIR